MFHLIEFLLNKTVAVVPQNWYSDGVTYWPNYKNDERVNRAVKNSEEPGPDWRKYDARVIKSCSIFILNNLNGCYLLLSKYQSILAICYMGRTLLIPLSHCSVVYSSVLFLLY